MKFTKQEQEFIDYLDTYRSCIEDLRLHRDNFEGFHKATKELLECKKEFFGWFRKNIKS